MTRNEHEKLNERIRGLSKNKQISVNAFTKRCVYYLSHPLEVDDPTLVNILKTLADDTANKCYTTVYKDKKRVKEYYYNIPCAFDIETSRGTKGSYMYIWQFNINGYSIYGRTWSEFTTLLSLLTRVLKLNKYKLVVYIQNVSYEYQYLRLRYKDIITKVFATEPRKILYFMINDNIIFKDSYILYGCSLDKIAADLLYFPFRKTHDLDYDVPRNSETPLTHKELNYSLLDVITLSCAIWEKINQHRYIYDIPLTKTGYVRRFLRSYMHKDPAYKKLIKSLTLDANQYTQAKRAFAGGFSHGNAENNGITIYNAISKDETSDYPSQELCNLYPIKYITNIAKLKPEKAIDICTDEKGNTYFYIADFSFYGLKAKDNICDDILSFHKCRVEGDYKLNNGRIHYADKCQVSLTNIDYANFSYFYTWDRVNICNVNIYKCGYLPKGLIMAVIELFKNKSILKNVKNRDEDYRLAKSNLNANYGAMVQAIVTTLLEYDNEDGDLHIDRSYTLEEQIERYNKSPKRFNYYIWGVAITAYARDDIYSVFKAIADKGLSSDYIISDTDSIKHKYNPIIDDIIKDFNAKKRIKLLKMCEHMKIDKETVKILCDYDLGSFTYDGEYRAIKQFGAKRYIYIDKDYDLHMTIAGLPKQAANRLIAKYGKYKAFEMINKDFIFNEDVCGKLTHYYIDERTSEYIDGELMTEFSSIILKPTTFNLSYSTEFQNFLQWYRTIDPVWVASQY